MWYLPPPSSSTSDTRTLRPQLAYFYFSLFCFYIFCLYFWPSKAEQSASLRSNGKCFVFIYLSIESDRKASRSHIAHQHISHPIRQFKFKFSNGRESKCGKFSLSCVRFGRGERNGRGKVESKSLCAKLLNFWWAQIY